MIKKEKTVVIVGEEVSLVNGIFGKLLELEQRGEERFAHVLSYGVGQPGNVVYVVPVSFIKENKPEVKGKPEGIDIPSHDE